MSEQTDQNRSTVGSPVSQCVEFRDYGLSLGVRTQDGIDHVARISKQIADCFGIDFGVRQRGGINLGLLIFLDGEEDRVLFGLRRLDGSDGEIRNATNKGCNKQSGFDGHRSSHW